MWYLEQEGKELSKNNKSCKSTGQKAAFKIQSTKGNSPTNETNVVDSPSPSGVGNKTPAKDAYDRLHDKVKANQAECEAKKQSETIEVTIHQDGMKMAVSPSDDDFDDSSSSDSNTDDENETDSERDTDQYSSDNDRSTSDDEMLSEGEIPSDYDSDGHSSNLRDPPTDGKDVQELVKCLVNQKWRCKKQKYKRKIQELKNRDRKKKQNYSGRKSVSNGKSVVEGTQMANNIPIEQQDIQDTRPGSQLAKTPSRQVDQQNIAKLVKSPSDTTLYKLALQKGNDADVINRISNFVESIQIESSHHGSGKQRSDTPDRSKPRGSTDKSEQDQCKKAVERPTANDVTEHAIVQAEQFKAQVAPPQGRPIIPTIIKVNIANQGVVSDNDDDFFHVTCHIEDSLKEKIQKGEYVDLERLLPKDRAGAGPSEENKLELFSKDGVAYFAPTLDRSSSNKISGLRRLEQAFRVYAAVYSRANPHRASEIWQYVHVINIAASAYSWDNVSFYDQTFRHLMSSRPSRSWSKTYTQGWNLAMTDPLSKHGHSSNSVKGNSARNSLSGKKDWRDYCCWKFNKNRCDHGSSCDWDH